MTFTIASMRSTDIDAVVGLHILAFTSAHADILPVEILNAMTQQVVSDYWKRHIERNHDAFVALNNDTIVGVALGGPRRGGEGIDDGEIYSIYVDPRHHGTGIGSSLLQTLLKCLAHRGWSRAVVRVVRDNPALAFYLHTGARLLATQDAAYGSETVAECLLEYDIATIST